MEASERPGSWRGIAAAAGGALAYSIVLALRGHAFEGDQLAFALPAERVFRDALAAGMFPLWTDMIWCGYPSHAEGSGAFLAFPARLTSFLPLDEVVAIEVELALALLLAALGAAWAVRELGRSPAACATAGVVWALGGGLLTYQGQREVLDACIWLPLVLGLAARHVRTAELRDAILAGGAIGLVLLGGWPYSFMFLAPILAIGWLTGSLAPEKTATARQRTLGFLLALAIGLAIGAAQWAPTFELFRLSDRARGLDPAKAVAAATLELRDLARLVSPTIPLQDRADRNFVFAYLGIPALALAALGIKRGLREPGPARFHAIVFALTLGILVLLALVPDAGRVLLSVPPLSFVRGPARLVIPLGLEASVLAAYGVDVLARRDRLGLAWLAFMLVLLDLGQLGQRRALPLDRELFRTIPDVARGLSPGRVHVLDAPVFAAFGDPDREGLTERYRKEGALEPNTNVRMGIPVTTGYGPLAVERSTAVATGFSGSAPTRTHLARAAAERILRWTEARGRPTTFLLPAPRRARIAETAVVASSAESAFVLSGRLPIETAVLEGEEGERARSALAERASGEAAVVRAAPLEVEIRAHVTKGPALLVLADTFYPGWEATVRGGRAGVVRADFAYRGVVVPEGESEVVFRYRPASFAIGLAASALGTLAFVLGLAATRRRGSSSPIRVSERRAGGA